MFTTNTTTASETLQGIAAKVSPPVGISLATVAGVPVSDLVLWATLIYTFILIGHKVWRIVKEYKEEEARKNGSKD